MSTRTYFMDDCTIPVPSGFRDRTVNVLEWEMEDGDKIGLVIQREPLPSFPPTEVPRPTLESFVEAQTKDYPVQFAGFCLERDEAAAPGAPFEIQRKAFRWKHEQHVLYHHQAFVLVEAGVVVLTGSGKARHREAIDRLLDAVLADFHARGD
jgi:hypothetical protein